MTVTQIIPINNMNMSKYSFKRGLENVPISKAKQVKREIMTALKITSRGAWYARLNGKIEPKMSEKEMIEEIFIKYGVRKSEIWNNS